MANVYKTSANLQMVLLITPRSTSPAPSIFAAPPPNTLNHRRFPNG
jgi:hypothetical protein